MLLLEASPTRMARRQLAAHAQPALHARRAAGRAGRCLSGRGVLAGPAEGHRRRHQRAARPTGDPRLLELPRLDAQATACASSPRCRARCTWRAPTRSSWAAARRWSTPTTAAPRTWAWRSATSRRSDALELRDGRFVAALCGERAHRGQSCVLAAGGFESNREWLREAWGQNERGEWPADNFLIRGTRFNQGVLLKFMIGAGADIIGDPTQSHCVAIDARAPLYDGGICTRIDCVSLGVVRQPRGGALLRRGRGFLAQALRDLGAAGRAAAGADRLLDHRQQGDRPLHAAGVSPAPGRTPCPSSRASSSSTKQTFMRTLNDLQRRLPGRHLRPHGARRLPHRGPDAGQDALGAADRHAALLRLRAAAGHHLHLPRAEDRTSRRPCTSAACRARTCSSPAR